MINVAVGLAIVAGQAPARASTVSDWTLDEASLPHFTQSYEGSVTNVPARQEWSFALPKFDTQGGTRQLVGVTLENTTTVTNGALQVENISGFGGTVTEITLALSAQSHVFTTPPFPAVPRGNTSIPFVPAPAFSFNPGEMTSSRINVPIGPSVFVDWVAQGTPPDLIQVDMTGHTTGLQQFVMTAGYSALNDFISSPGDSTILCLGASQLSGHVVFTPSVHMEVQILPTIYTTTDQVIYEYVVPKPTQEIVLAFGNDAPARSSDPWLLGANYSPSAAVFTSDEAQAIRAKVRDIFAGHNIDVLESAVPRDDASNVYLLEYQSPEWRGITVSGQDRFNGDPHGTCLLGLGTIPRPMSQAQIDQIAYDIAHEVGHTLGLNHVSPGGGETTEIMNKWGALVLGRSYSFNDDISNIQGLDLRTHNPVYHLMRYTDGVSDQDLRSQGVDPGTYDLYSNWITTTLSAPLIARHQLLYNVVAAGFDPGSVVGIIETFEEISIEELCQKTFDLPEGFRLYVGGSSEAGISADVFLCEGDPDDPDGRSVFPVEGVVTAVLYQSLPSGEYLELGGVEVDSQTVPEPATAGVLLAGVLMARVVRRGKRRRTRGLIRALQ